MTEAQFVKKGLKKKKHLLPPKFTQNGTPKSVKKEKKTSLPSKEIIEEEPVENVPEVEKVTKKKQKPAKAPIQPVVKHKKDTKWYDYQVEGTITNPAKDSTDAATAKALFDEADLLLRTDFDLYSRMVRSGGSDAAWLFNAVKTGTARDRKTAMQLQMFESPIHSLPYVDSMISSVEKKHSREAMDVIPILEEVFVKEYLPPNRKLISFSSRPLGRLSEISTNREDQRKRVLVLWMFEHKLKHTYERFTIALEGVSAGVVEDVAKRALKTSLNLIAERPEAEQRILTILINKLGHPKYRIGSYVATLLEELTRRQPNMRAVIVKETERLVYRKNVSDNAHIYAVTFLSQICLRQGEYELAVHLLTIYFGLFKTVVAKKPEDSNKLLGILLTAANRAFPYAKDKAEKLTDEVNTLFKVVQTSSFSVAIQTLKFVFQVLSLNDTISDRFFSSLYRRLFTPIPTNAYNELLQLLYRSLKADASEMRIRAFVKRLLQIATGASPPFAAGILILVSKLSEEKKNLIVTSRGGDKLVATVDVDEDDEERYFDLDVDGKKIVKTEAKKMTDEDSDEEEEEEEEEVKETKPTKSDIAARTAGWVHKSSKMSREPYDVSARNPMFIDCRQIADAELLLLSQHYHPSVAIFANQILQGQTVNYKGDPLEDYTLMKFLDRFAYKNPKATQKASTTRVAKKKAYDPWGVKKLAVTSKEYLNKKSSELPPDERYLHRFAQLKFSTKEEKKEREDDWEIESVGSEEFDRLIERFEPGEANEEFDVDFGQEFSAEKQKKTVGQKRKAVEESDGEDDELDEDEYEDMEDDDDDDNEEGDEDDDEDEDDEDIEMESDEDDRPTRKSRNNDVDDSGSDGDFGDNDAEMAADRFGALLEDIEDEEESKKKNKHKTRKPKGFKRR